MTDLIKRLEEAEVGSRELDISLAMETTHPYGFDSEREIDAYPHPTTSIDDALALAERVLPGCLVSLFLLGIAAASVECKTAGRVKTESLSATPALALCIAILKATDTGRE